MGASGKPAIAFDVFGTLVDPAGVTDALQEYVGDRASAFAAEWRRCQVEYLIRHAAMDRHRPFAEITTDALVDTAAGFGVVLKTRARRELLAGWWQLPALPDAAATLDGLADAGFPLVAFSNGAVADVDRLLQTAGLRTRLGGIHGVETSGTYKPAPRVYRDLATALDMPPERVWLVSANYWDAAGARSAGLNSAWIARGRPAESGAWAPVVHVEQLAELVDHPALESGSS